MKRGKFHSAVICGTILLLLVLIAGCPLPTPPDDKKKDPDGGGDPVPTGELGNWAATTPVFTNGRERHAAATSGGYLIISGGYYWSGSSIYPDDIQYCEIDTDGNLTGAWGSGTLPVAADAVGDRAGHTMHAHGGNLFVIGGYNGTSYLDHVQYAPFATSVGAWGDAAALNAASSDHASVIWNGRIYVLGGANPANLDRIEYSDAIPPASWTTSAVTLPTVKLLHSAAVHDGYLFVIGGSGGASTDTDVVYIPINPDGSIDGVTGWQSATDLPVGVTSTAAVAYNGFLYVVGGRDDGGPVVLENRVWYAEIQGDGTLEASWHETSPFATGRYKHAIAIHNDRLYLTGGDNETATYFDDIQVAPFVSE